MPNGEIENAETLNQQLKVTFSRPMNKETVENGFSMLPNVNGTFSWSQNTLFYTPTEPLAYDTTYSLSTNVAVKDKYRRSIKDNNAMSIKTKQANYLFIGEGSQLFLGDISGSTTQLTQDLDLIDYYLDRSTFTIILQHYDNVTTFPRFSLLDIQTKKLQPILDQFVGKIYFSTFDENTSTLYFNFNDKTKIDFRNYIYTYNLLTQEIRTININDAFIFAFWPLPDQQSLLIQDLESRFFLYNMDTFEFDLLGTYLEYIDVKPDGSRIHFRKSEPMSRVIEVSSENKALTEKEIDAVLPTINAQGDLLAYSYKPYPVDNIQDIPNFRLRIISLKDNTILTDLEDTDSSFEYPVFSPNSQYVALTNQTRIQGEPSGYILPSLRQNVSSVDSAVKKIRFYDVHNKKLLDVQVDGKMVTWL